MTVLRRWLRGLWIWWALSALVVMGTTGAGWYFSMVAFWTQTDADLEPKIHSLVQSFATLSERQSSTVLDLRDAVLAGRLTAEQLQNARLFVRPFLRIYYVQADGRPVLSSDTLQAPGWMIARAGYLGPGTVTTLRPVPEGVDLQASPGGPPPPDYLTVVLDGRVADPVRGQGATYLIADADLDYVFGPWLEAVCRNVDLGHAVARRVDHEVLWKDMGQAQGKPTPDKGGNINFNSRETRWTRRVTVFPTTDAWPFDAVELSLDVGPDLAVMQRSWMAVAVACLTVLGGFAVSLGLAGVALGKDLAAAHIRANFTAMVSHELKTPVAAICLTTEILENKLVDDPAKIDEYHTLLHREALRLKRLIENVMRLLGLGGQATLEPLAVGPLVEQAVAEASEDAGVPVEVPSGAAKALVDKEAAVRAVANVVQNALKYGGSDVMVTVHEDRRYVFVDVMDRGPGIPRKLRQAVFEPYFRIQDEDRREKPGSGLGLALVKVLMERQSGRVTIHDRPGGGSVFRLAFRRA